MVSLIDRDALIAEYDRLHIGKPGQARQLMVKAPEVDAVPVVRCCDCKNYKHWECPIEQAGYRPRADRYCAWAERKTDPSDRPITCDYCKHWHGLKRDGRYWCSKYSAYMETGCEEGERKEE